MSKIARKSNIFRVKPGIGEKSPKNRVFDTGFSDLADLMSLNGPHRAYKFDRAAAAKPKHGPHEMFPDRK